MSKSDFWRRCSCNLKRQDLSVGVGVGVGECVGGVVKQASKQKGDETNTKIWSNR
jgi:hypothetical protein